MITTSGYTQPQQVAIKLMQNDLRFLYTIIQNRERFNSNYMVSAMPYIGVIVDGVEDWVKAYNNSNKTKITIPQFSQEEQEFFEEMRSSIKLWNSSYSLVYTKLENYYQESDEYFSNICSPIAKKLKIYDIFGADIVDNEYCGNTILCSYYIPQYNYSVACGERIKRLSEIGGKYIRLFCADKGYNVKESMQFSSVDYGGLRKSPFGNDFSDNFVLFSLLCQINFIIKCIDEFLLDETTTKLRFIYLLYHYIIKILPEINNKLSTNFTMDDKWINDKFRNAMAHYKIGVALKESEIDYSDPFYGLTQKYFKCDYASIKNSLIYNLKVLSDQLKSHLMI